ncbi:ABC transporter permease [Senegalia massiliensis]
MLGDLGFIIGTSLMYAAPLLFTALGGVMSENSGVVNIGLEGMMSVGAFTGAAVGYFSGNPWLAFILAGLAAGVFGLLHAIASVTFHAEQVVSGIAINFLGPGIALFMSRLLFNNSTMTKSIDFSAKMPRPLNGVFESNSFLDLVFNQYATVYMAFILVFIVWFTLYKTKLGLRIRAVGEHPAAADTLGVSVTKIRYLSVILSGVFAGFGGAAMSIAVVSNFRPTLISGQGFIALAAVIFGKWKPQGAMWACLLFGAAQGLTVYLGGSSIINISSQLLAMLPYLLTLIILTGFVGRATAPTANGEPYQKGER